MSILIDGTRVDLPKRKLNTLRKQVREEIETDNRTMVMMRIELEREKKKKKNEEKKKQRMKMTPKEWKKKHTTTIELWKTKQWKETIQAAVVKLWISGPSQLTGVYQLQLKNLYKGRPVWNRLQPLSTNSPFVLRSRGSYCWAIYHPADTPAATSSASATPFDSTWSMPDNNTLKVSGTLPESFSNERINITQFERFSLLESTYKRLDAFYCGYHIYISEEKKYLLHAHHTDDGFCWGVSRLNDKYGDSVIEMLKTPTKETELEPAESPLSLRQKSVKESPYTPLEQKHSVESIVKESRISSTRNSDVDRVESDIDTLTLHKKLIKKSLELMKQLDPMRIADVDRPKTKKFKKKIKISKPADNIEQVTNLNKSIVSAGHEPEDEFSLGKKFDERELLTVIRTTLLQDIPDLSSETHNGRAADDQSLCWNFVKNFSLAPLLIPLSSLVDEETHTESSISIPLTSYLSNASIKLKRYFHDLGSFLEIIYTNSSTSFMSEMCNILCWPDDVSLVDKKHSLNSSFRTNDELIAVLCTASDTDLDFLTGIQSRLSSVDGDLLKIVYQFRNGKKNRSPSHRSRRLLHSLAGRGDIIETEEIISDLSEMINWVVLQITLSATENPPKEFYIYVRDGGIPLDEFLLLPSCNIGFESSVLSDSGTVPDGIALLKVLSSAYFVLPGRDTVLMPPMIVAVNQKSTNKIVAGVCTNCLYQFFSSNFQTKVKQDLKSHPTVRFAHPLSTVRGIGPHLLCIEIAEDSEQNKNILQRVLNVSKSLESNCLVNIMLFSPYFSSLVWSEWGRPKNIKFIDFSKYDFNMTNPDAYGITGVLSNAFGLNDVCIVHIIARTPLTDWEGQYLKQWLPTTEKRIPICVFSCHCLHYKMISTITGGVYQVDEGVG